MRIFVTGGIGFIGSVVARELVDRGHEVIGLARSESSCKILEKLGASVFEGSLEDLASLHRGADLSDAVINVKTPLPGSLRGAHLNKTPVKRMPIV